MRLSAATLCCAAVAAVSRPAGADIILTVGATGQYRSVGAAVAAADQDTNTGHYYDIQVAPGTYLNDFAIVTRAMSIVAAPGSEGRQVLLDATEPVPNQKGIIVTFASLTVDGLTFEGAAIANSLGGNGAGIRDQNTAAGASLTVRNSSFIGNQSGILTGNDSSEAITVSNSKFENNGNPNSAYLQHALYVNYAGSLTVDNSLFCGQLIGHDIKSRARSTTVRTSQIYDGQADPGAGCRAGSSSFAIDMPNGGAANIFGDQIIQGGSSQNAKMIAYGEEGLAYGTNSLVLGSNALTNIALPNSIGVYDPKCVPVQSTGNTFNGVAIPVYPPACVASSAFARRALLVADDPPAIPEPGALPLLAASFGVMMLFRRRLRSAALTAAPAGIGNRRRGRSG